MHLFVIEVTYWLIFHMSTLLNQSQTIENIHSIS